MFSDTLLLWIGFTLFVLAVLALDLGVLRRGTRVVSTREAALWTGLWAAVAVAFGVGIYAWQGGERALEFFTGYLIEYALSVDNIFVFVLIFSYFGVPAIYQHRVLFWGIVGAIAMRGLMIVAGAALLQRFHPIIYVFGALLLVAAVRMARHREQEVHPETNPLVALVRRLMPVTATYHQERFFVRQAGRLMATPLFIVLLMVESTDLVFAVDSIPAIFAVTQDPFIVYTSNVFAILGLRSLYFVLRGAMERFHYLRVGLSAVLGFVGAKMLLTDIYKVPIGLSLLVIVTLLGIAMAASLLHARRAGDLPTAGRHGPKGDAVRSPLEA